MELGAWGAARWDRPRGCAAGSWDSPCPALPPFLPVLSVCPCPRACVCVYIIIYLFVCGRGVEVGRGLVPAPGSPWVFICPAAELLQAEDLGEQGAEGAGPAGVQSLNSCSLQCFQSLLLFQTRNCCLGTCCC